VATTKIPFAFGKNGTLPADVVTQVLAFIGRRGAGKTYGANKLVEGLLGIHAQTVVIDPIGNWYGLRLTADGKAKAFDIPVFGGLRGDIPIEAEAGALIANVIVDHGISAVIDVSQFSKSNRRKFVTDFAEQLFMRRKSDPAPMHVVLEEAQIFAPQRVGRGNERMLGAFEDLIRLGRNHGIGISMLSQRPQSVNKEVLNQVEALIAFQLNGAHERRAVEEWVRYQGLDIKKMVDELPSLPVGTAFLWSPQWLRQLRKIRIAKKKTYDASATPQQKTMRRLGKQVRSLGHKPRPLKASDLDELRKAMKDIVERAEERDPVALRKRIAMLEAQLRKRPETKAERVEVPVLTQRDLKSLEKLSDKLSSINGGVAAYHKATEDAVADIRARLGVIDTNLRLGITAQTRAAPQTADAQRLSTTNGTTQLRKGARRMLGVLASFSPGTMTKRQVAGAAKMKSTSGTFNSYWSQLNKSGLIAPSPRDPKQWQITDRGRAILGASYEEVPRSLEGRMAYWRSRLRAGAVRILDTVYSFDTGPVPKETLAATVGMSPNSGTFNSYLSLLKKNRLLAGDASGFTLHPWLLGEDS